MLVIEGGVVSIPGSVAGDFRWKNLSSKCPAWMAEVMILALEKRYETYSLGNNIGIGQVEEIGRLAHKHGFKLAGFQVLGRLLVSRFILLINRGIKEQLYEFLITA